MAIYSFNHDSFGKTTNRAGAAGDNAAYNARENETRLANDNARDFSEAARNAAYNAREEATYAVRSHIIPPGPKEAEAWFRQQEQGERKNARMSDRFIGALPRELTPEQCIEAVESFCRDVTQDRVPWHFALHLELDKRDKPDWNPHCHIIFRDRDIETGRRVLYTTAGPKERAQLAAQGIEFWTTKDFREEWGEQMNRALERAGHDARVDHRTLKEQGIDRTPQIHIGPGSQNAAEKGHQFESQDRLRGDRTIPYSILDEGSRAERNAQIIEGNKAREQERGQTTGHQFKDNAQMTRPASELPEAHPARAPLPIQPARQNPEMDLLREAQAEARRTMYAEQKKDRDALREAQAAEQRQHRAEAKQLYAGARQKAFEQVKEQTAEKWQAVRAIESKDQRDKAAEALKLEQKKLYGKTAAARVAELRPQKNQAWEAMKESQLKERSDFRATHREEFSALVRQHSAERIATEQQQRAQLLQHATNRNAARMSGHQGMANQQKAAVETIRLKQTMHMPSNANNKTAPSRTPSESAKAFMQTAIAEHDRGGKIRAILLAQRQSNRLRAGTPERFRSQSGKAMHALDAVKEPGPQSRMQQAVQSGRTLSSEERANASPELKAKLNAQDKAARQRQGPGSRAPAQQQQQSKGKDNGRSGGGRGR